MAHSLARAVAMRARWRGAVAVAAVAMAVAGCGSGNGGSGGSAANDNHTIGVVLPSEPLSLEPCNTNADTTAWVLRENVTQTLAVRDPKANQVQPVLAKAWKQLSAATWQFTLRSGVKFQNGASFGAADVVHTIQRLQNAKLACTSDQQFFSGEKLTAKAVNSLTVDITTDPADPILPLHTSFIDIVPRTTPDTLDNAPVGTGPYKFVSWQRGTSITLARWSGYWGTKPQIAGVKYQWRDNPTVAAGMVKNGEADFAFNLSPDSGAGSTARTYAQSSVAILKMDETLAPLNDQRVRLAIHYAINDNAIIKSVFNGYARPATQVITSAVDGFDPNLKPWPYDPAKAKQLLAQAKAAGVDVSKQITLYGRTDLYANATQFMEAVQQMLTNVGLNVKLEMLDHKAIIPYQFKPFAPHGPDLVQGLYNDQCGDASCDLAVHYSRSSAGTPPGGGSARLDQMIQNAANLSGTQRTKAYQKAVDYITDSYARDVYVAQLEAIVAVGPHISYTPSAETDLRLPIADITYK